MSSKNRKTYESPLEAFLGGIRDRLSIPKKKSFAELSPEEQREVLDWMSLAEQDGPAYKDYVRKNKID